MADNVKIVPTFYRLYPRRFQNEYTIGVATTAADSDQYEAEGFKPVDKEVALHYLSRRPENGEQLYASATLNGAPVEDRFDFARRIRRNEIEEGCPAPHDDAIEAGREAYRIVINLLTDNQLDFVPKSGRTARQQMADIARRLGVDVHGRTP